MKPSPNVRLAMTAATLQLIASPSPEISTQVFQQEHFCFLLQWYVLKHREPGAPQIGKPCPCSDSHVTLCAVLSHQGDRTHESPQGCRQPLYFNWGCQAVCCEEGWKWRSYPMVFFFLSHVKTEYEDKGMLPGTDRGKNSPLNSRNLIGPTERTGCVLLIEVGELSQWTCINQSPAKTNLHLISLSLM